MSGRRFRRSLGSWRGSSGPKPRRSVVAGRLEARCISTCVPGALVPTMSRGTCRGGIRDLECAAKALALGRVSTGHLTCNVTSDAEALCARAAVAGEVERARRGRRRAAAGARAREAALDQRPERPILDPSAGREGSAYRADSGDGSVGQGGAGGKPLTALRHIEGSDPKVTCGPWTAWRRRHARHPLCRLNLTPR